VTTAGSGLVFSNTFDATVSAAYQNCVIAAETALAAKFQNAVTINVSFTASSPGQNGVLASNSFFINNFSYATVVNALTSHATTPEGKAAAAALSGLSDPSGGAGFWLPSSYAAMLGLIAQPTTTQDFVTLNTSYSWSFGQDVTNVLEHEITEGGMGRVGGLGVGLGLRWSTMDLFSFNTSGARDFSSTDTARVFSWNNGAGTSNSAGLSFFAANSGSDAADFQQFDVFGTGTPGETNVLSLTDINNIRALGWNAPAVRSDFIGNGTSNILFFNSGTLTVWSTSDGYHPQLSANAIVTSVGAGWNPAGIGDFNGDGRNDLIWQNGTTFTEWQSTGTGFTQNVFVGSVGSGWNLMGVGDFSGDGKSDLLWQNGTTFTEWQSTGNGFTANAVVGSVGSGWTLAGVGDFNADGRSDLIWQNGTTFTEWQSTGGGFTPNVFVGSVSAGWTLAGVGNFTGNGRDDLAWFNAGSGLFSIWDSTGNGFTANSFVGSVGSGWSLVGVGDYQGTGMDGLLFRNSTTGAFSIWQSTSGGGFTPNVSLGQALTTWTLEYSPTGAWRGSGPAAPSATEPSALADCIDYTSPSSPTLAGCIDYTSHSSPTLAGCIDYTSPSSPTLAGCIDYTSHSSPTLAGCIDYTGQSSSPLTGCVDYLARHV
jgi:hypothetical protein